MSRTVRILLPVLALLLAALISVILFKTRPTPVIKAVEDPVWWVDAVTVNKAAHQPSLLLYGHSQSPSFSQLSAAVEADVSRLLVRAGEQVSQGQALLELDTRELELLRRQRQADLAELDAAIASEKRQRKRDKALLKHEKELLALAERAVTRATTLSQSALGSQANLDEALQQREQRAQAVTSRHQAIADHPTRLAQLQARRETAAARLAEVELDLQRSVLRAPFAGRVVSIKAAPGQRVRPGEILIEVFDRDQLEIRAQLPATYADLVQQALLSGLTLRASLHHGGSRFELTLERLAASVAEGQAGLDAFFIPQPGLTLPLGRVMEVLLQLPAQSESLLIPREALYDTNRVYKIIEDRLYPINVEWLGEQRTLAGPGPLLVRSAELENGDLLLASKLATAMGGLKVQVRGDRP